MSDIKNSNCYIRVFNKIDELLKKDDKLLTIAIDGRCGSGKSHLAELLARSYECNVFHMDDFFLPFEMRTKERLGQPGGNVHYERFKEEVLTPLRDNQTVIYRPYICGQWRFDKPKKTGSKKLNIIEGSYCLHPQLRELYDLSIFMEVEHEEQLKRILKRNGKEKLQDFIEKWIPLENLYFSSFNIKDMCDIIIDTTLQKK